MQESLLHSLRVCQQVAMMCDDFSPTINVSASGFDKNLGKEANLHFLGNLSIRRCLVFIDTTYSN